LVPCLAGAVIFAVSFSANEIGGPVLVVLHRGYLCACTRACRRRRRSHTTSGDRDACAGRWQ
jgi:hypothetical protein